LPENVVYRCSEWRGAVVSIFRIRNEVFDRYSDGRSMGDLGFWQFVASGLESARSTLGSLIFLVVIGCQ
jgi:hypothetical protein